MKKSYMRRWAICICAFVLTVSTVTAQKKKVLPEAATPYFTLPTEAPSTPTEDGFLQRWMLLEPISAPVRTNTVFTDSYLREKFYNDYLPTVMLRLPKDGSTQQVGKETLRWHALDSKLFNVKLFRFATSFEKQKYGVVFWAVTAIDSPEEMPDVRLAIGSNGASIWWLNGGKEAVMLSGDRRMVRDDVVSPKLTLKKGRNYLVGAVINGPGMSDFCVRFLDAQGNPIRNIKLNVK